MSSITFPYTNLISSKLSSTDGANTAMLEPTNLTVDNVTITSINGSPYIAPLNYISVDGNASGNIHMTSHTLDFVDGNYTASFSAGDLTVDNVNLTKINDVPFVPAVNYISSSGVSSGDIDISTFNLKSTTSVNVQNSLTLIGTDASSIELTSSNSNLSLNKTALPLGDYTISGYLPIVLSGTTYYMPLFQPTLSGGSSGPIGLNPGVPQIP
jgi:hypothetical protein